MTPTIYCILNLENQRHYIGSSINFQKRRTEHIRRLDAGRHHSPKLQNAWNKYGRSAFRFDTLEVTGVNDLVRREQFWINQTLPFYNISRVAGRPTGMLGHKHSDETKARMMVSGKGRTFTDETRAKMSRSHMGKKLTEETKAKMVEARVGYSHSEETRQKISDGNKGRRHSVSHLIKLRDSALRRWEISWPIK